MSGITTQFSVSAPSVPASDTASGLFGKAQLAPRQPSDTAFFRGVVIAGLIVLPLWAAVVWLVYQAL